MTDIEAMLQLPRGKTSLVDLDLKPVEKRLVRHPWVKGVVLSKQFPNTLQVQVIERTPIALIAGQQGQMVYIEKDGTQFEEKGTSYGKELPLLTGVMTSDTEGVKQMIDFVQTWFDREQIPGVRLSSLSLDPQLGLRAVIVFPLAKNGLMRSILELGLNLDEARAVSPEGLRLVLQYLSERSKPASRIWLGDGKKIVVKMARGS